MTRNWSREQFGPTAYTEAQIFGGVGLSDVDHAVVHPASGTEQAKAELRRGGVPYRQEESVGFAKQLSLAPHASASARFHDPDTSFNNEMAKWGLQRGEAPGGLDLSEPVFADTEVYQPGVHHTFRDREAMRRKLRESYPEGSS